MLKICSMNYFSENVDSCLWASLKFNHHIRPFKCQVGVFNVYPESSGKSLTAVNHNNFEKFWVTPHKCTVLIPVKLHNYVSIWETCRCILLLQLENWLCVNHWVNSFSISDEFVCYQLARNAGSGVNVALGTYVPRCSQNVHLIQEIEKKVCCYGTTRIDLNTLRSIRVYEPSTCTQWI